MTSSGRTMYADMMKSLGTLGVSEASNISHIVNAADISRGTAPATALRQALSPIEVPIFLYEGIAVTKVTSGGALKHRILTLSRDHLAFLITHQKVKTSGEEIVANLTRRLPTPVWTPRKGFTFSNTVALRGRYIRHLDIGDIDILVEGVAGSQQLEALKPEKRRLEGALSFYHHGMSQVLNLFVDNAEHRGAVLDVFRQIKSKYQQAVPFLSSTAMLLRYHWYHIDQDQNGHISNKEFKNIIDIVNLQVDVQYYFDQVIRSSTDGLTYPECLALLLKIRDDLSQPPESWSTMFGEAIQGTVSPSTMLTEFLHGLQGETTTSIEDAQRLVSCIPYLGLDSQLPPKACSLSPPHTPVAITKDQFQEFLFSEINSAYDPSAQSLPDVSYWGQSISKYWINTSHNTYLLGDQLQSKSSVEAYTKSLYRGCKCLELDCWDGNNKQLHAVVFHGHTLTSKIFFVDILRVVKAYLNDHPDTLPIILSLENHCSHPYQLTMAQQLEDVLGDQLYVPSLPESKGGSISFLPSPNQLRGMVVIKGKRPPEPDERPTSESDGKVEDEAEVDPYDAGLTEFMVSPSNKTQQHKSKIVPELARLTLFHGTKFKSFETTSTINTSHMHSIGESKITKILNKGWGSDWRKYNQYRMTRTYPAGFRLDSSNYNPTVAWAMGCQLVALNFQTPDTPMLLNDGRFRQACSSGYVMKPESVLGNQKPSPRCVKITVLAGRCLPKPKGVNSGEAIDPYVRMELHDVIVKEGKEEYSGESWNTPIVSNNGFCPTWEPTPRVFKVQQPDVAMLLFQVLDDDLGLDDKIASCAIPVSCLRTGIRSVPLYKGHQSNARCGPFDFATLLVRIEFMDVD